MANTSIYPSPPSMPRFSETDESNDGIRERLSRLVLDDKTTDGSGSQTDDNNCGQNLHNAPVVASRDQPSREDVKNMIRAAEVYIDREILTGSGDIRVFLWHLRNDKGPVGVYLRHFARKRKGSTFETLMKNAEVCSKNSSLQLASSVDKLDHQNSEV